MPANSALTFDTAATYEIRIQGYLDENWVDYLSSVIIRVEHEPRAAPVTVITGKFQDQAALVGALSGLYSLGMPLLSVQCIGYGSDELA